MSQVAIIGPDLAVASASLRAERGPVGALSQACPRVDLWLGGRPHHGSLSLLESSVSEYVVCIAEADAIRLAGDIDGLQLSHFRDRAALERHRLTPISVRARSFNARTRLLGVGFSPAPTPVWTQELRPALPIDVAGVPGVPRNVAARITRLGAYEGCFELDGERAAWVVGALLTLRPRAQEGALRVQVTTYDASGRYWFRVADQSSVARAALLLLRSASTAMSLSQLPAYGVSQRRGARELSVKVVDGDQLRDALHLRLLGNQAFGRLRDVHDESSLRDTLDDHAVNIVCYLGERAVGTGRVVLNGGDRSLSEIETEVGLPDWLWERGFAEVSRVAIHPQFRGGAAMIELFREVARIGLTARCRYLVLDCIEKLVPTYQRIGARLLGREKRHPYSSETVHVMAIDLLDSLASLRGNLAYWVAVFGPVVEDFHAIGALDHYLSQLAPWQRSTYRVKLALSKIGARALAAAT